MTHWTNSHPAFRSLFHLSLIALSTVAALFSWLTQASETRADLETVPTIFGLDNLAASSLAWGDWDGDGDLDLAVGNGRSASGLINENQRNRVYENIDGNLRFDPNNGIGWQAPRLDNTTTVAWGDMDSDGDLDLAVANYRGFVSSASNYVYENISGTLLHDPAAGLGWTSGGARSNSLAWGDVDGDGDLDIAVGNDNGDNHLYLNDGDGSFAFRSIAGTAALDTRSVAWGDADLDGDLDLAVGNLGLNHLYRNDGSGNFTIESLGTLQQDTRSVAWADMNGDGDLDLAVGNWLGINRIYRFSNTGVIIQIDDLGVEALPTTSVAWGDWDGDLDLDLFVGNNDATTATGGRNEIFENMPLGLGLDEIAGVGWIMPAPDLTTAGAWADVDADGALDLAVTNEGQSGKLYLNHGEKKQLVSMAVPWLLGASQDIAWGDVDNDGDLDLAKRSTTQIQLHLNSGAGLNSTASWSVSDTGAGNLAWVDWDGDGYLDLSVGSAGVKIYPNQNGSLGSTPITLFQDPSGIYVAWADWDGDGDLDLAAGKYQGVIRLYRNDGNGFSLAWTSSDPYRTTSLAWGDWDNDGDQDLAVGNRNQPNLVFENLDGSLFLAPDSGQGWHSAEASATESVAWGDWDGDGDLELAVGNGSKTILGVYGVPEANQVYENENGTLQLDPANGIGWVSPDGRDTSEISWGDWDGDGDLDLAVGNQIRLPALAGEATGEINQVFENRGGLLRSDPQSGWGWESPLAYLTASIAWGDVDGDGDLDLAAGNGLESQIQQDRLYQNLQYQTDGAPNLPVRIAVSQPQGLPKADLQATNRLDDDIISIPYSLSDEEGDVVGQIVGEYSLNGGDAWQPAKPTADTATSKLPTGRALDLDGLDDYVFVADSTDINLGVHNARTIMTWFKVDDQSISSRKQLIYKEGGDVNGLAIYIHNGRLRVGGWAELNGWSGTYMNTTRITAGRWHHVALVLSGSNNSLSFYLDGELRNTGFGAALPQHNDSISIGAVHSDIQFHDGDFFGNGHWFAGQIDQVSVWNAVLSQAEINRYRWFNLSGSEPGLVAYWPFDEGAGGLAHDHSVRGNSHDALLGNGVVTQRPAWTSATAWYLYKWDTFESGFFGQSDNLVFRIRALPQAPSNNIPSGRPIYYNSTGMATMPRPYTAASTFPFRARGTQVRVYSETVSTGNEVAGAMVYRLPVGQTTGAALMASPEGMPLLTTLNGYLAGRGRLDRGDQLMALLPSSSTDNYTLYHTSAAPNSNGLSLFTVNQPGVQELAVSAANQLILFDLDVSLEWDARGDTAFMDQLGHDILRASQILYDLSNGQVALGRVRIQHARVGWNQAHLVIQSSNSQRPSAMLGGIVMTPTNDIDGGGNLLEYVYLPGQVRLGPTWSRFGDPGGTLGEDWPRALAHELGHYLLYLPDNYLGISPQRFLSLIDCPGSAMSDPYNDGNSEFLTAAEWQGSCLNTLAEQFLDRADWETIHQFYPTLNYSGINPGPSLLPLAVTQVTWAEPVTPSRTIVAPFFSLTAGPGGPPLAIPGGRGEGYLQKTGDNSDPSDDYLVSLGAPVGDLMLARGAEPGDRLCVFDYSQAPPRLGCVNVGLSAGALAMEPVPDWQPQVTVTPVSTRSFAITVTNVAESNLQLQLLPSFGQASLPQGMNPLGADFVQTVDLADPAFAGYVRIWVPGASPLREIIVEFLDVQDWAGRSLAWGGRSLAWGGRSLAWGGRSLAWGAPVQSSDGQVSLFALDDVFGSSPGYTLQALPAGPALPAWLSPVGRAYRVAGEGSTGNQAILFRYLGRDVPAGHEADLAVYYRMPSGQTWQRLATELDPQHNHAAAMMSGEGVYALVATVEMPAFAQGWNNFGYLIPATRPVAEAVASIDGQYTAVANFDPQLAEPWRTYYPSVAAPFTTMVNTLSELERGRAYWLYATRPITLYLGPETAQTLAQQSMPGERQMPPATFYGWVTAAADFEPAPGMIVTAEIGGHRCGQSAIQPLAGGLAYRIQVSAENLLEPANQCGTRGSRIVFKINGRIMDHDHSWDNSVAWFHPLYRTGRRLFLPLVPRAPGSDLPIGYQLDTPPAFDIISPAD